jgi:dolichyl-phosphate-mannose--protein O-mannosyl transferase
VSFVSRVETTYRRLVRHGWWAVVLLGGFLRFYNLGDPKALIFDETFYVKDAWSLIHRGYETTWPMGADARWAAGDPTGFTDSGSFVVHPPLGKFLISLPMVLFGAQNSWTWRLSSAIFGTLAILLVMLVAKKLLGSQSAAVLAGLLFAIDGHAIVLARTALLDGFLMFFVLLAFYFLLLDREQMRVRYQLDATRVFWKRPWLVAMAAALGLATSVKWSGLYVAVFFGAYIVVSEALLRRRLASKTWVSDGFVGQKLANLVLTVPVYLAVYVFNWLGWILTDGGWDRHSKGNWWESLAQYHHDIYNFHVNLHTPHAYASNPFTWLFMLRPVSFWWQSSDCPPNPNGCAAEISAIGNPFIWWAAAIACIYLLVHYIRYRNRTEGLILLGLAAGYIPWMLYLNRTIFEFYAITFLPFTIIGLVYVLRSLWYRVTPNYFNREDNTGVYRWRLPIAIYLVSVGLISFFFLNLVWGFTTPYWYWLAHMWLGNWWI